MVNSVSKDEIIGRLVEVYSHSEKLLTDYEASFEYERKRISMYNHGVLASMQRVLTVVRAYLEEFEVEHVRNGLYTQSVRKREMTPFGDDLGIVSAVEVSSINDVDTLDTITEIIGLEFMVEIMDNCMAGGAFDGESELLLH